MNVPYQQRGFSLVEMMIAVGVFGLVIAGVMSGWLFVIYGERQGSIQDKLDIDVRMTLENIRRDLRLSSMDKIYFYPAGVGPYTAISMPMAVDSDGNGLVELDTNNKIIWDYTKIYHQYGTTMQFRITTITNRDNTLNDTQRQAQLAAVAVNGTAAGTYEAANAKTRTLFQNLFTWNIKSDAAVFDGYSPTLTRDAAVVLGSALLASGNHDFRFTSAAKNPSSSGYKMGLDAMDVSPSGGRRELEKQTIFAQSGASAVVTPQTNGSWGGNYDLTFPATATGQYVTLRMENDRWEDENFGGANFAAFDTSVEFDYSLSPMDYVVKLLGTGYTWTASEQTGDKTGDGGGVNYPAWGNWSSTADLISGCAVRVLFRGNQMADGGYLKYDGTAHFIRFSTGASNLRIMNAYIAECANTNWLTPDTKDRGKPLLFNGTNVSWTLTAASYTVDAWPVTPFIINREKSYIVSFLVDTNAGYGNAAYWVQPAPLPSGNWPYGCYIIPATSNPDTNMTTATQWSGGTYGSYGTSNLFAVMGFFSYYPTNGTYESTVYDTHQTAPTYQDITWASSLPAGSDIRVKVRSDSTNTMATASPWSNVAAVASGAAIAPGAKRYIQYRAELRPTADYSGTPELKNMTIRFAGESKIIDIGGAFTKGPDYGTFELTVDGAKLQKGVTVAMQVYEDTIKKGGTIKRLTSQAAVEVEPRNTGK